MEHAINVPFASLVMLNNVLGSLETRSEAVLVRVGEIVYAEQLKLFHARVALCAAL